LISPITIDNYSLNKKRLGNPTVLILNMVCTSLNNIKYVSVIKKLIPNKTH
jgi:hypothetical protein